MPPIRITARHEAPQVEFEIAIKGRAKPLTFSLPKLHYIDPDAYTQYIDWLREHATDETPALESERQSILKLLELNVPAKVHQDLQKLSVGELRDISGTWNKASRMTLGESEPSENS